MKLFKFIYPSLILSVVFILTSNQVFSAVVPGPGIEVKNQTEFTNLSFEDKVYKPGDVVKASFIFVNNDSSDYTDISLSPYLMVFSSTTKAFNVYGIQNKVGSYYIPRSSGKVVSFEYTIPQSGNIMKDSVVRLAANVFQGTGASLGPVSGPVKIGELIPSVDVVSVYVKANNNTYGIQEGPVISATTSAHLIVKLKNNTGAAISLNPKLTIFDVQPSRPEVGSKSYDILNLKKDEAREINIELSKISKPGVYAGELHLFDEKGIGRSTLITSRWIVDGDMVTIPNVSIDKSSLKKGDKASVTVVYTGAPTNIDTGTKYSVGNGKIEITVYGDGKEVVFQDQKDIDFNTLGSSTIFSFVSKEDVSKISVLVVASKDGNELARYGTVFTDPDVVDTFVVKEPSVNKTIIFSVIFPICLLLLIVLFIKIRSKKISAALFFAILFSAALVGLGGKVQAADRACLNGQFCAQGSLTSNLVVTPNTDISSDIWNVAEAQVCANGGGVTTVVYEIYDSNNNLISNKTASQADGAAATHDDYNTWSVDAGLWYQWAIIALNNKNYTAYNTDIVNYNYYVSLMNSYNMWRTFTGFNPNTANSLPTNIIAPSVPGTYKIVESVSQFANYRDAGRAAGDETNGGVKTQGPISFEYKFTVSSPPVAPTITSNGGTLACGTNNYTLTWADSTRATSYGVNIVETDITTNISKTISTTGCTSSSYSGDWCVVSGNSYSIPISSGHSYRAYVSAHNDSGWSSTQSQINFSASTASQCACVRDRVTVNNNQTHVFYGSKTAQCGSGVNLTCSNGIFTGVVDSSLYPSSTCGCTPNYVCQGSVLVDLNVCTSNRLSGANQQCTTGSRGTDIYNNWELMKINSFFSSPSYIAKNNSCTLKYNISNGSSTCSIVGYGSNFPRIINLINGSAIGSTTTMSLASSTTYRLSCSYGSVNIVKDAVCRVLSVAEY